jgi:hypothetical protein
VSALDDRALTTLAWSLGSLHTTLSGVRTSSKQHEQSAELAERLRGGLRRIVGEMQSRPLAHIPAQGLSNVAWSCAKCNLKGDASAQLLDGIAEVLQMGRPEQTWNAQDLSNLAWALGRLRTPSDLGAQNLAALSAISTAALKLGLHRFRPQGLSNLVWAYAHLAVPCSTLSQAIYEEAAARKLRGFSSQEVSNLAWAATVIDGSMPPKLCTAIAEWLETSAFHRPQEVSITAWAFAKTQAPCPSLVEYLRMRMVNEPMWLRGFSDQAISNLVWSLAKLQAVHDEDDNSQDTIALVLSEVERRTLLNFKPQEISQMVHALATWGDRPRARGKALLSMFENFVLQHGLDKFEEKHLACISWTCGLRIKRSIVGQDACEASDERSFALPATILPSKPQRARRSVEARIETLVRREVLARGLPRFTPRHLSQLLWANALADRSANDLLMAVRHELLVVRNATLTDFSADGLVHLLWAFARMLGEPSQLGGDIALLIGEELEARSFDNLPSRYVSTLLWSMARLGAHSPHVFRSAHKWLARDAPALSEMSAQSLVMTVWAMSTVSEVSEESLARVEQEMLRRGLDQFQPQELNAALFAFSKYLCPPLSSLARACGSPTPSFVCSRRTVVCVLSEQLRKIQLPVYRTFQHTTDTALCFSGRGRPRPGPAVGTGRYGMPLMPRPAAAATPPSASVRQSARQSPCPCPPHASRPAYQSQGIREHANTCVMMAGGPRGRRMKSRTGLRPSLASRTCSTRDTCGSD